MSGSRRIQPKIETEAWQRSAIVMVLALISLAFGTQAAAPPAYPLKRSANGRYLVDQNNTPFLMVGARLGL